MHKCNNINKWKQNHPLNLVTAFVFVQSKLHIIKYLSKPFDLSTFDLSLAGVVKKSHYLVFMCKMFSLKLNLPRYKVIKSCENL